MRTGGWGEDDQAGRHSLHGHFCNNNNAQSVFRYNSHFILNQSNSLGLVVVVLNLGTINQIIKYILQKSIKICLKSRFAKSKILYSFSYDFPSYLIFSFRFFSFLFVVIFKYHLNISQVCILSHSLCVFCFISLCGCGRLQKERQKFLTIRDNDNKY